ncbi:sensor histidine kinase, partial [Streptomyces sp. NPDC057757]
VLHAGVLRDQARAGTVAADPDRLTHRLELLRTTAARSLDDLRDVLGALRAEPPERAAAEADVPVPSGEWSAPFRSSTGALSGQSSVPLSGPPPVLPPVPAPALRDLTDLIDEANQAGQQVELALAGDPEAVPTTHRLAVHRVVQEALTNARKHAHAAPVTVRVGYGAPATTVEVRNGPGGTTPNGPISGGGYGLVGLGERVGALGGHLDAGPDGAGGFRLSARLPAPDRPAQSVPSPHAVAPPEVPPPEVPPSRPPSPEPPSPRSPSRKKPPQPKDTA